MWQTPATAADYPSEPVALTAAWSTYASPLIVRQDPASITYIAGSIFKGNPPGSVIGSVSRLFTPKTAQVLLAYFTNPQFSQQGALQVEMGTDGLLRLLPRGNDFAAQATVSLSGLYFVNV